MELMIAFFNLIQAIGNIGTMKFSGAIETINIIETLSVFPYVPYIVAAIIGAILIDLVIGDPRWYPHPVILMGRFIHLLEKRLNQGGARRFKGLVLTIIVVGTVFSISILIVWVAHSLHWLIGLFANMYLVSTTIAIKGLKDAALAVAKPLKDGNIKDARYALSMIVGRDTETLDDREIVRGTVETVAENTVDGVTAPLFFALIGGAPAALAYRAINTLDSMVGYKNEKYELFGWASARLDDLVNWFPARLTALCIWLSAMFVPHSQLRLGWSILWRDAKKHPSPNSGWTEALVAGLLGVQLGGINTYQGVVSKRATMGVPNNRLQVQHIYRTITYLHGGWMVFTILIIVLFLLIGISLTFISH